MSDHTDGADGDPTEDPDPTPARADADTTTASADTAPERIDSPATFRRVFADALDAVPAEHRDGSRFAPGIGPTSADIVLVGEAPGATEVTEGEPFVGQAGRRLDSALESLDVDRADLYLTNVVKVRPPENRTPRVGEIDAWAPVLSAELDRVDPVVVVPLGTTATQAVLDTDEGVTALHGQVVERDGRVVVPTFHPAATFYDDSKTDAIIEDIRTALEHA